SVWEPIAKHLPGDTDAVYLAPDGPLGFLPWAALPGDTPGSVLLEKYTVALVPHGRFLIARLRENRSVNTLRSPDTLLAIGGVKYDERPAPADQRPNSDLVAAASDRAGTPKLWTYLKGTEQELNLLSNLHGVKVRPLRGTEAGTGRLLQELPKARRAHL